MSDIMRLKEQLHHVFLEAKQAAGGLGGFQHRFGQSAAQVQALISGSATGADRDIAQILDAASKSVGPGDPGVGNGCGRLRQIRQPDLTLMPSDLQRVAQGLVECLDQIPAMVDRLQRLTARCRENARMMMSRATSTSKNSHWKTIGHARLPVADWVSAQVGRW